MIITNKKTIQDLKRETDEIVDGIVGKSETLDKVVKIRRPSSFVTKESLRQKENQRG